MSGSLRQSLPRGIKRKQMCIRDRLYTIFDKQDIVARSVRVENHTGGTIRLDYVLSSCIDHYKDDFDFISFHGKANGERSLERVAVNQAKLVCESRRGSSSHQKNPFVIFCSKDCGEDRGECYGSAFVYSGNFTASIEKTQMGTTRFVMGIHPEGFHYVLENEESFQAPEVIHSYSREGFSKLTHNYHNVIRRNLCRGKYKESIRPCLLYTSGQQFPAGLQRPGPGLSWRRRLQSGHGPCTQGL